MPAIHLFHDPTLVLVPVYFHCNILCIVVCRTNVSGLVLKFSCIVYAKQKKIELWNKRHFLKNKLEIMQHGLKWSKYPCCQYT
jgi:hypothetical protein